MIVLIIPFRLRAYKRVVVRLLLYLLLIGNTLLFGQDSFYKISRSNYQDRLYGFWLGQCIGNWTGLTTEMDKVGNLGDTKSGAFYTRENWGSADIPNIWGEYSVNGKSTTIDYIVRDSSETWGADDDTDIEYIYQTLLSEHKTVILTGEQIRDGWLKYIRPDEENYLWVSNQKAFDLMKTGTTPPSTSDPKLNIFYEMIDAQLTTEIFGLFSPTNPEFALKMSYLPIRTTARENAAWIAEFYVSMYSLAASTDTTKTLNERIIWMADQSRKTLPDSSYAADMYDYVRALSSTDLKWEQVRDSVYVRYQVQQKGGYDLTARSWHCNSCFAAGINFASSLVSLFYGKGDIKETIKIGTLAGWDSDNPTATWGGMLGFMIGKSGIEKAFGQNISNQFNIHRTRQNFANKGIDNFDHMSKVGLEITDRVVVKFLGGKIENDQYFIPKNLGVFVSEKNQLTD